MELSFWELESWFSDVSVTVVGSGIVGLHAALRLRDRFPKAKILVLERGVLPQGASTKNAGFACFGSLSEIVSDLKRHTEEEVVQLIAKRWQGLKLLRDGLGDDQICFKPYGGYELFGPNDDTFATCLEMMPRVNEMLRPLFGRDVYSVVDDPFGFGSSEKQLIYNAFEAQIDSGKMMQALLKKAVSRDILILNRQHVTGFSDAGNQVEVRLGGLTFKTRKLVFATNGFASGLTSEVVPARAQVLITDPIEGLHIKGTFHIDEGYYYFRNVGNRILFGGGRNLDFEGETTTDFGQTDIIQNKLESILRDVILPGKSFSIAHRWSGIMGMGDKKSPVVRQLFPNVYCGVRLGGMGVAIGSLVGKELADMVAL